MNRVLRSVTLGSLLFAGEIEARHDILPTETQGPITFISGGIGKEEQDYLRSVRHHFNLHLLFAVQGSGAYVGGAKVRIANSRGAVLLDTYSDGPSMFVKLRSGQYRITAEYNGRAVTQKITVRSKSGTDVVFAFPPEAAH